MPIASAALSVPMTGTLWITLENRYRRMITPFGAPRARAASTYDPSLALTVVLRTTLKYCGM